MSASSYSYLKGSLDVDRCFFVVVLSFGLGLGELAPFSEVEVVLAQVLRLRLLGSYDGKGAQNMMCNQRTSMLPALF